MSDFNDIAIDKGFSKISNRYETLDRTSSLISWMRKRVRTHFEAYLTARCSILEINCGSGIDAVYFAKKGHMVHATDLADGMIDHVKAKINSEKLKRSLTCEVLSFENLHKLNGNTYSHIFSNFGGLNCSSLTNLEKIFDCLGHLLQTNGVITFVIMPKVCSWELLRIFKGNKKAFRRLKKNGILANIEGEKVHVHYHSVHSIKALLKRNFTNFKVENICFLGPTGNRVDFPERHPLLFKLLTKFDTFSNHIPFLRGYGDYYIISAQKR